MKSRCTNINNARYNRYGGRGISYDPIWGKFDNFFEDMGNTWFKGATLERKDVNGNYSKENCIWITKSKQGENRSNSIFCEINGEILSINQMSDKYNINYVTILDRYYKGIRGEKLISPVIDNSIDIQSDTKGVTWDNVSNKWYSRISVKRKSIHLGKFNNLEDAINARKEAEIRYFGKIKQLKEKRLPINQEYINENKGKCIGVIWLKRHNKWQVSIMYNKILYRLGNYFEFKDAIMSRLQAELKFYGEDLAPQRHLFKQYKIN